MSQSTDGVVDPKIADPGWKALYRIGGIAALIAVVFFRRNTGTELVTFDGFGIWNVPATLPSGASEWFMQFQDCAPLDSSYSMSLT